MKTSAILLTLLPLFGFAQQHNSSEVQKINTTACPTWDNKKQPSKAEYFQSLRTSGKAKNTDLAMVTPKEKTIAKKQMADKPVAKKEYIPAFSTGDDIILENKKANSVIAESKTAEKPAIEKKIENNQLASTSSNDRVKAKSKNKKVKNNCSGATHKKIPKNNNAKCPAF